MSEKALIVSAFSSFSSIMVLIAANEYGTLIFNSSYEKDEASKNYISNRLSIWFIIAQGVVICSVIFIGYITDKVKVWKMVLLFHVLLCIAITLFICYAPNETNIYSSNNHSPVGMTAGFIGMIILAEIQLGMVMTLGAKSM